MRAAIQLAIGDRRSVRGYRLVYEPLDDALAGGRNPFKGDQNAKIMTRQPAVVAVIGPYNSDIAGITIPITNASGLVMISPSNTVDCLTFQPFPCLIRPRPSPINNYFRVAATDSAQAAAAARFGLRGLGLTRFAAFTDGSFIGNLMADTFADTLTKNGGSAVYRQTYSYTTNDYAPILRAARAAGAQAIFVGGAGSDCAIRSQMAGVFPSDAFMLSSDRIVDLACIATAGGAADDHLLAMVSSGQPQPNSAVFQEFRAHHIQAVPYVFNAYDCAEIILAAIDRAIEANGGKVPSRREVLDAVASTKEFVGASGTFTFTASGDATNPAVSVYRVQNSNWTFWENAN